MEEGGDEVEISLSENKQVINCGESLIFEGNDKDPERDDQLVIEYSAPVNFIILYGMDMLLIKTTYI